MIQQKILFEGQSQVGNTVVLWKIQYSNVAYTDQFGKAHAGNVVFEEIVTTIVDQQTVKGEWGISEYAQAICSSSQDGREFRYPGSGDYWYLASPDDEFVYVDVCRVYNRHRIFATPDGQPNLPVAANVCPDHKKAYLPNSERGCFECDLELKRQERDRSQS